MMVHADPYPGSETEPAAIFRLAEEYRHAAKALSKLARPGAPETLAPFRLAAIHAIELYLNAWLLMDGIAPSVVRGLQHDLAKRAEWALHSKLTLRIKTARHLVALSVQRDYLVSRYAPELLSTLTQRNRLEATLEEVARKVARRCAPEAKSNVALRLFGAL
ncbi:hypothetical protein FP2506_14114 [Fulvimarina pelagi HTCC2506]|uniref:HEPN domain-containing protein n=1 Tax=Fulvimarina pelagi HTCC2506 TaxID=314231 RepID=Q0G4A7_9HYPH|nr:hypothetical protein [Fulvimarina pelagi]EAU41574.1 hypothetical protein FP2506_14114 [Fulvimarina pelagi HTCC2506]